jgi:hypothetical protein
MLDNLLELLDKAKFRKEQKAPAVPLRQVLKTTTTTIARSAIIAAGIFCPDVSWFHPGQACGWNIDRDSYRVLAIIAGKQGGKSTFGLPWFFREIQLCGPGHYCLTGPSYVVLNKRMIPDIKQELCDRGYATYNENKHEITFTKEGMLAFYGTFDRNELYERYKYVNPDTGAVERKAEFKSRVTIFVIEASDAKKLEAGTYKAALAEEFGSTDVSEKAFDNLVNGRLVRYRGRCCIVTTPYDVNWLKYRVYDAAFTAGKPEDAPEFMVGNDGFHAVVRFESWMNPEFGMEEFVRIRDGGTQVWYFDMMYRGIFTRPVGSIFDCFDRTKNTTPIDIGQIPAGWDRLWGMDFGAINCAAVKVAFEPGSRPRAIAYMSYHPAQKLETGDHVKRLLRGEKGPAYTIGGKKSGEQGWRNEFGEHGLWINEPEVGDHEVRIQILYGLIERGDLIFCSVLTELIKEIETYKRVADNEGNITMEIHNKAGFHRLDALLYIAYRIFQTLKTLQYEAA